MATQADAFGQVTRQYGAGGGYHDYTYDGLGRVMRTGFAYTGLGNDLAADGTATYTRDADGEPDRRRDGHVKDVGVDRPAHRRRRPVHRRPATDPDRLDHLRPARGDPRHLGHDRQPRVPVGVDRRLHRPGQHADAAGTTPSTGQFDTRDIANNDPVPDSINANRYQYGDGNPLTVTDPTGQWGWNPIKAVKKAVSKATSFVSRSYSYASSYAYRAYSYCQEDGQAGRPHGEEEVQGRQELCEEEGQEGRPVRQEEVQGGQELGRRRSTTRPRSTSRRRSRPPRSGWPRSTSRPNAP